MRIFLLLLFLYFAGRLKSEEAVPRTKIRNYCTISKIWNCTLKVIERNNVPDFVKYFKKENETKNELDMQFVYQTPVDAYSGELFVSNMMKWRLDKRLIKDKNVVFFMKIDELKFGKTVKSKFIKVEAERGNWTKRALLHPETIFTLNLEKKFDIGKEYRLTLLYHTIINNKERILASISLVKIPELVKVEDNFECTLSHINRTRKMAGRWTTGIRTFLYPVLGQVNITFYAAPKVFCIDQYEVQIAEIIMRKEHLVDTVVIEEENLIQNGTNIIGNVIFKNLKQNSNYSITVKAMEYRRNSSICLCRVSSSCDCVSASTESFKIPKIGELVYEKFVATKYSEVKILPKLDHVDDYDPLWELRNYTSIIIFGIIVFLLFLILGCGFYRKTKTKKSRNEPKVLLKLWKNETMDITPLIRNQKYSSLFILNADDSKHSIILNLINFLKKYNINVIYPPLDCIQLEQNIIHYVHKSINVADKILFFHSEKSQFLIRGLKPPTEGRFDEVYSITLSMVSPGDPKMVHIRFSDSKFIKESFAETFLEFPRDIKYFIDSIGIEVDDRTLEEVISNLHISAEETNNLPELLKIERDSESSIITTSSELPRINTSEYSERERSPDCSIIKTTPEYSKTEASESIKSFSTEEDRTSVSLSPSPIMIDSKKGISIQSLDSGLHSGEICA